MTIYAEDVDHSDMHSNVQFFRVCKINHEVKQDLNVKCLRGGLLFIESARETEDLTVIQ